MRFATLALLVSLLGAGCLPDLTAPRVAEPLSEHGSPGAVTRTEGFGKLPTVAAATRRANVTLSKPLPLLPDRVTVLRLRRGTPNDTEFRNLANTLGISDGFMGTRADVRTLDIDWSDDKGVDWSYRGADRLLDFEDSTVPTEPVTVASLPMNAAIAQVANTFLIERGVNPARFREPIVDPDWNAWWKNAQDGNRCVDPAALASIRALAASTPSAIGVPPSLPDASKTRCISPEFPAKLTVRYRLLMDGRDVVRPDGSFVDGAKIVVDVSRNTVVSGQVTLVADPDRSDYAARTATDVQSALLNGGVAGISGAVTVTGYDVSMLRVSDDTRRDGSTYLIPSLIALGSRTRSDGAQETVRIVVPLAAQ